MLAIKVSTKMELKNIDTQTPPPNKMDLAFMKRWVLSIRVLLLSLAINIFHSSPPNKNMKLLLNVSKDVSSKQVAHRLHHNTITAIVKPSKVSPPPC